jgi:hypothetical protein
MAIVVRFIGEAGNFLGAVDKSIKKTELFSKKSTAEFKKVTASVAKWGAATAAAMAAATIAIVNSQRKSIDELAKTADAYDFQIKKMQAYRLEADLNGISAQNLDVAIKGMRKSVGDAARVGGRAANTFRELGLNVKELSQMRGDEQFDALAKAISGVSDRTRQASIASELFGRNGQRMLKMLDSVANDGAKNSADQLERMGVALNRVEAAQIENMNDALTVASQATEGFKNQLTLAVSGPLTAMAKKLTENAEKTQGFREEIKNAMNAGVSAAGFFLDALHGVKVVFAGLGVLSQSWLGGIQSVFTGAAEIVAGFVDFQIVAINKAISGLNKLNPFGAIPMLDTVSDSEFMKGLKNAQEQTAQITEMMQADFQALLMSKMPSEGLKQFVAEAIKEAEKLAEAAAASLEKVSAGDDDDGGVTEAERKRQKERLQIIRDALVEEEEILAAKFAAKIEQLQDAKEREVITEAEYNELAKTHQQQFMDDLYQIRKQGYDGIESLMRQHHGFAVSETVGAFKSMLGTAAQGSKRMFEINKQFALGDALISTYQGIAAGVKLGYPMAIPAVAWAAANGFKQVSSIRAQSYGGGGGGGASASAQAPTAAPQSAPETFNVRLQGFDRNQGFGGDQMSGVFDFINNEIRNGRQLAGIQS